MKRWGMKESDLPGGSTILNRQPNFIEAYGRYIVIVLALLFTQLIMILMLLEQRSNERKAKARLRESEERFRTMVDGAPILMWMSGLDKLCTDFNRGWLNFTGRTLEQGLGNGWAEGVHPDDLKKMPGHLHRGLRSALSFLHGLPSPSLRRRISLGER